MSKEDDSAVQELVDILGFVLDIASSLDSLLDVYPPAVHALHPTGISLTLQLLAALIPAGCLPPCSTCSTIYILQVHWLFPKGMSQP